VIPDDRCITEMVYCIFCLQLEEFVLFEENLASLVKLASTLPQGNCGQSSSTVMTTASPSNITMTTTTMGTNSTHHQPEDGDGDENDDEKTSDKVLISYYGYKIYY